MKIMTFNLRYDNESDGFNSWSLRKEPLLKMIHKHQADVIGTQETTDRIYATLKDHFHEYEIIGDGRESNRLGERCSVMIKKDKYKVLKSETVWLNGDFYKAGDKDEEEGFPRICTMVLIQDKQSLEKTRIFNTHLAYRSEIAIVNNGKYLLKYIKHFEHTKIPFVLMGDFNVEIDHPLHKLLLENFKEAYMTLKIKRPNTFHGYLDPLGISPIDFIYTNSLTFKSIETDQSLIDDHYPSDHYPLIAELQ